MGNASPLNASGMLFEVAGVSRGEAEVGWCDVVVAPTPSPLVVSPGYEEAERWDGLS